MKIEMGESLFYSWLRHVKDCQIVQTNWTTSSQWSLSHKDELNDIMTQTDELFREKYGYNIYKKNASLSQVLQQAECDVLGVSVQNGEIKIYAIGNPIISSLESNIIKTIVVTQKCNLFAHTLFIPLKRYEK